MTKFADSLGNQNEIKFADLYNQPEYKDRQNLTDSDYYIIAYLNPNQFVHIDSFNSDMAGRLPQLQIYL
jgi:hypothetical protein